MEDELKREIIDMYFSEEIDNWLRCAPTYDIDYCAHTEVEVEPEDAKNINEVRSFNIKFSIMGTKEFFVTRKVEG